MKHSTRIILVISTCLISIGIVLSVIGICLGASPVTAIRQNMWNTTFHHLGSDTSSYDSGNTYTVSAANINDISIDWVSGNVKVVPYDGTDIIITESPSGGTIGEDNSLRYELSKSGNELKIYFNNSMMSIGFGNFSDYNKELVVQVPASTLAAMREFSFGTVSADVEITGLTSDELNFETVSGNISCSQTTVQYIEFDTTSGVGNFELLNCPREGSFESISGDVVLYLPSDSGFSGEISSISGKLTSEFPSITRDDQIVVGDGRAELNFDSTSGDINIKQGLRP